MKRKLVLTVVAIAIMAALPFAVVAQEVDLTDIEARIRVLEDLEARLAEREARLLELEAAGGVQLPVQAPQFNTWAEMQQWMLENRWGGIEIPQFDTWEEMQQWRLNNGWGRGLCWDADGTWLGPGGCWRFFDNTTDNTNWNTGNTNWRGGGPMMGGRGRGMWW
ncbi:MAG: hypothetical protein FWG68_00460 [Defluviitaleaceae bacterium]|nr:hypothetical protein [Defluviitaleaceae bacterium]